MNVNHNINGASTNQQQYKIDPAMKIGHVSLNVSDLSQSIHFYQSVLGFKAVGRPSSDKALLVVGSDDSSYVVELLQVKTGANNDSLSRLEGSTRRAGLYHFAILLPERKFLADMLQNLNDKRDQVHFDGLADHLVSESIYIRDPDFNGVEIYSDRPKSQWRWKDTQIEMATLPLNTTDLLKEATEKGWKVIPNKTTIGHVHLHVSDIAKAMKFYHQILGLQLTAIIPRALFFAAGGYYHHHIATNTWLGTGIAPASSQSIGLNHFSIELPSKEELATLIKHFSGRKMAVRSGDLSDRSVFVRDMDSIEMQVEVK